MGTLRTFGALAVVLVLAVTVGFGLLVLGPGESGGDGGAGATPTTAETPAGTGTQTSSAVATPSEAAGGTVTPTPTVTRATVQPNLLASEIHDGINSYRSEEFREPLSYEQAFQDPLHAHAADMAEEGYLGAEGPDGTTVTDRLANVSNCRPATAFARYEPDGQINERAVADTIVDRWRESQESSDTVLTTVYNEVTIGVAQSSDGTVYVALAAC